MEIISHRRVDISSPKQDSNFIYSFIYILKQGEFKISKFSSSSSSSEFLSKPIKMRNSLLYANFCKSPLCK